MPLASLDITFPGDLVTDNPEFVATIRTRVRNFCGWPRPTFPGSQPVSLGKSHLKDLVNSPYVACEKTDGVRFLLYSNKGYVFLIDRTEAVRACNLHLPTEDDLHAPQSDLLLDGELVSDHHVDCTIIRFLVYDVIAFNGETTIRGLNLLERLHRVYRSVIMPRIQYEREFPECIEEEKAKGSYFEIYLKDFFEVWDVPAIWNFKKRLPHECDGIIFTPVDVAYVPGTCRQLLKWKPPEMNTVDFAAYYVEGIDGESAVQLLVANRGERQFEGHWLAVGKDPGPHKEICEAARENPGVIVECSFHFDVTTIVPHLSRDRWDFKKGYTIEGGWIGDRVRSDRTLPNDFRVTQRILQTLEDGISFGYLVQYLSRSRTNPLCKKTLLPDYYKEHGSRIVAKDSNKDSKNVDMEVD